MDVVLVTRIGRRTEAGRADCACKAPLALAKQLPARSNFAALPLASKVV